MNKGTPSAQLWQWIVDNAHSIGAAKVAELESIALAFDVQLSKLQERLDLLKPDKDSM